MRAKLLALACPLALGCAATPAPNLTQSGGFAPPAPPPTGELLSPLSPPHAPAPALIDHDLRVRGALEVFGGATLFGDGSMRFEDSRVSPPGALDAPGFRLHLLGDAYGIGVDSKTQWYASAARHAFFAVEAGAARETASIDAVGNVFATTSFRAPALVENGTNVVVGDGKNAVFVVPKLGTGGFNHLSRAGDSGIVFGANDSDAALVIAPWSSRPGGVGLRVDAHGVTVDGDLEVRGTKRFVEPHPDDPSRELVFVALEGPEAGTYCRGTARVAGARTRVALPESFAAASAESGLTAQVTPLGPGHGLYLAARSRSAIEIGCDDGAACPKSFDWLVQGVRRGHENHAPIRARR